MSRIAPAGPCLRAVIVLMPLLLARERNQSLGGLVERQAKGGGDTRAIGGIGLGAVGDVALLDLEARDPALVLGPMIVTGNLSNAWLYVAAPIAGALIAVIVNRGFAMLAREPATAPAPTPAE